MDKVNKHPWAGQRVVFATRHQKEKILSEPFSELGLTLVASNSDTDQLGTFSGEIERKLGVRETLQAKIKMAMVAFPDDRFFLANEGSFGPHPIIGLLPSNLESFLFFDRKENFEIYSETLSTKAMHAEHEVGPREDVEDILNRLSFPEQGVIVRPADRFDPVFKGLHEKEKIMQALICSFAVSQNGKVILAADLRALHSPLRQKVILEGGQKLVRQLNSFCARCAFPGFSIIRGIEGLRCHDCGNPTRVTKDVIFACGRCGFEEIRPRPDGLTAVHARDCEYCNP